MKFIFTIIDKYVFSLPFLKGYRTKVSQIIIAGMAGYQFIATEPKVIELGVDLPDIPVVVISGITLYLTAKIAQFAREHN